MANFKRESPALKEILLKLYRAEKPVDVDHHLYEFGSVEYHIQFSASEPHHAYVSISTPLLSQGDLPIQRLSTSTIQSVKAACSDVVDIIEPTREGHHLTLRVNFSKIPRPKDSVKIITGISTVQAAILGSQLKDMLCNVGSNDTIQGMHKPIKLVYHRKEPFFVIRQPEKVITVFPMRFKENSDVILATAFFQELMDVGNSATWANAPPCTWSAIPPPELRGELLEDLSTNGGFVSFDISSRHVRGKKLDKTVWSLLNFYALVKYYVKSTRGFIQRRMRVRMESLVQILQKTSPEEDEQTGKMQGFGCGRKLASLTKTKSIKRGCTNFTKKIRRIQCPIRVKAFSRFRRRWLTVPKCSGAMKYTKLD